MEGGKALIVTAQCEEWREEKHSLEQPCVEGGRAIGVEGGEALTVTALCKEWREEKRSM